MTPLPIVIREFEPGDLEGVYDLYASTFGEEAMDRLRRRWRWQFFDNPAAATLPSRLRVADQGGAVVGFVAAFPVRQKVFDREMVVRRSCDLMVAGDARRHDPTVALRLMSTMKSCPGDTLWVGMGYSPENRMIRRLLRHKPLEAIPFYVRPQDVRPITRFLARSNGDRPWWAPRAGWLVEGAGAIANTGLAALNLARRPRAQRDSVVEAVTEPGEEFDVLWRSVSAEIPIIAIRDRSFVQWRFVEDPVFENTVLLARSPEGVPTGYLAMRLAEKGPMRMGRILDVVARPDADSTVEALLHAALERFRSQGVAAVSCLGLHPVIRRTVKRYLYLAPSGRQHAASLHWKGEPELAGAVFDPANWHLSQADGDEGFSP